MEILEYFFYKTIGKHIKNKHRVRIAKFGVFQFSYRIEKSFFEKNLLFFKKNLMPRRSLSVVFDGVFTALLAVSCG